MGTKLRKLSVESRNPDTGEWDFMGHVLLYPEAPEHEVEHALVAVGVYAPRGLDSVAWMSDSHAVILDGLDQAIVRLGSPS